MRPRNSAFWQRLIQPHKAVSGEKRRAAVGVLAAFMLGLTVVSLLLGAVHLLATQHLIFQPWLAAGLFFLAYVLSRSPRPVLSEFLIVAGLTAFLIGVLIIRGPSAHGLAWSVMTILLGAVLLPMWAAVAVSVINIAVPFTIALSSSQLETGVTFTLLVIVIFVALIALATKYARERDLQQLEQQTRALSRSRARYKQLFDDVPVGLFETTPDGQILQANPAMLDILGYPDRHSLQAVTVQDLYVDPADREQWTSLLNEKGSLQNYEMQFIRSDGKQIWARENVRVVPGQQEGDRHYRGSIEDITEQRRLQAQLAEQHEKLQMIIGAMPNVLLVVDDENRLTALYMPPNFPPLLKQDWATTMERLVEVLPSELADETQSAMERVRATGVGHSFERAVWTADAEESVYLRVKLSAVTATGDILIVVDDVTELKQAEEAAYAYAAELELRNEELDAFSHTVAHDLRGPLGHIVGYADLIKQFGEEELSAQTLEFVIRIEEAAYNMSEMIQGLLMLAKLRDTKAIAEKVDMSAVIETAVKRVQPDIEQRDIDLNLVQPIPDAMGYGPWLEEVFANLLSNAIKYIGDSNNEPRIAISALSQGEHVRYEVSDNGLGISPEDQKHLFEMLTRFHKDQASGTGLGLSIVQRIITRLGGDIGANSEPGEGSTFWFTLPAEEQIPEMSA